MKTGYCNVTNKMSLESHSELNIDLQKNKKQLSLWSVINTVE
jgi:hypothetical protein